MIIKEIAVAKYLLVVPSSALPGRDAEYNAWYDGEHLRDLLKVRGIVSGRRFDALQTSPHQPPAKHLGIYEIEADDPLAVLAEIGRRVESGEMSMTADIDPASVQMWIYQPR